MFRVAKVVTFALLFQFSNSAAQADIKIKTRTTVMGHSTESTVYIKGARERREMSFGGRMNMATITQCDQKRFITISGNSCTIMPMGNMGEESCPASPAMSMSAIRGMAAAENEASPKKGGVVTVTRTSTDTGERQEMFGYKAKHIKSSMSMESSPDACNQSHVKMETDGWYADLMPPNLSCGDDSARTMACGGGMSGRPGAPACQDRVVLKGSGAASPGFPLKQTMTIESDHGTFTTTTEVVELTSATLDQPLFEMPTGCRLMEMPAMSHSAAEMASSSAPPPSEAPREQAPAPSQQATPPPAPVAPKTAGVVRVGVVKIKDSSGEGLPTDNLRINLMSEIARNHMEAVPLDSDTPESAVQSEAREKQCDYILYTNASQLTEPASGGLTARHEAKTLMTVYKVGKPVPEIKEFSITGDDPQLGVNAVMATFEKESDKLAQQVQEDAHPKAAKAPAKRSTKPH